MYIAPTFTERELHHYGAPLNALVVLDAYRCQPDSLHLLEIGVGGLTGTLTNINATDGLASMAWHGSPQVMARDATDCDYGVGFFGHASNAAAFVANHTTDFASNLSCFLCNLEQHDQGFRATPVDAFHKRMYYAPLGLDILAEVGLVLIAVACPARAFS